MNFTADSLSLFKTLPPVCLYIVPGKLTSVCYNGTHHPVSYKHLLIVNDRGFFMPTLAAETSVFPESLLETAGDEFSDRRWWAVQTKARQEKSLARELLSYEIPFYLPLVRKYSKPRGRRICSHLPFFSGYIFLYADELDRVRSLTTNRIVQLLPVIDQETLRQDLFQLHRLIESDAPLTFEQRLEPGQRVRIKNGLMRGVLGTLICRRGETRLLVAIDFLQQGASLEIDDFQLEPVEG